MFNLNAVWFCDDQVCMPLQENSERVLPPYDSFMNRDSAERWVGMSNGDSVQHKQDLPSHFLTGSEPAQRSIPWEPEPLSQGFSVPEREAYCSSTQPTSPYAFRTWFLVAGTTLPSNSFICDDITLLTTQYKYCRTNYQSRYACMYRLSRYLLNDAISSCVYSYIAWNDKMIVSSQLEIIWKV
jgi:hypothetical protein